MTGLNLDISEEEILELFANRHKVKEQNYNFYIENQEELRRKYGGKTVAIIGGEVKEVRQPPSNLREAEDFIDKLKECYGEEEAEDAYVSYISKPESIRVI